MKKQYYKIIGIILLLVLVAAALLEGLRMPPVNSKWPQDKVIMIMKEGQKIINTGDDTSWGEVSYDIPKDCKSGLILSTESFWCNFQVLLNGEELFFYEDIYEEQGTNRQWIRLPDDASGKVLTLKMWGRENVVVQMMKGNIYLGDSGTVLYQFFRDNLYALVFGIVALILTCVLLGSSLYLRYKSPDSVFRGVEYLVAFIVLIGIWGVTDSQLLQIISGKTGLISLVSFISFMAMAPFLLLFVQEMMIRKRKGLYILCGLYAINLAICMLLYLFEVVPLYKCLVGIHLLIVLSIVIMLKYGIEEIRKYNNGQIRLIIEGFGVLSVFSSAALVVFYFNPSYQYAQVVLVGLTCFILFLAAATLRRMYTYLEKSASMEAYRNMAYVDGLTCMGNRNAFIEAQKKEKTAGGNIAYLVFDINNLKTCNDQFGHSEGDRLIQSAAKSIQKVFGLLGKCYRIGGDEFVVVILNISQKEMEEEIKRWEACVQKINNTRSLRMEIAWGFSIGEISQMSEKDIFAEADADMYRRKQEMKQSRNQEKV